MYSIPSLLLLAVFAFLLVKGAIGVMGKERESANTLKELEEKAETLEEREYELEGKIARIKTEEGLFEAIKEKFSVIRAGEHVAIIVDERATTSSGKILKPIWYKRMWTAIMSLYE